MSKRIKALDLTADKVGKFVAIEGTTEAEAERFSMDDLLANSDIVRGSASLSAGTQEVLFTDIGTTSYLIFANVYDNEGSVSFLTSSKQTDRFTVQVAYAATMDYLILKT